MQDIIEKNLNNFSESIENTIFDSYYSKKPGLLQQEDNRVKLVLLILSLVSVSFSHKIAPLLILLTFSVYLAYKSLIPADYFLKRVWFLPIVTSFITLPYLFLGGSPGSFFLLVLKVAVSVSFSMLLILTTPWSKIMSSFRVFLIPYEIIAILGLTYRYIHLLVRNANNLFLGRKSRILTKVSGKTRLDITLSAINNLFIKSFYLADNVYDSMISRGFTGKIVLMDDAKLSKKEYTSVFLFILLLLIVSRI